MKTIKSRLVGGLRDCGLTDDTSVYVHSSLTHMLLTVSDYIRPYVCELFLDSLRDVVTSGIVASPGQTWETARYGLNFDVENTPVSKDLGIFPEYLRLRNNSYRTEHPVQSIVFNGSNVSIESKIARVHKYAFGVNSPWDYMVEAGFKVLFFGLPDITSLTLVHHVEQLVGVPYGYNKVFQYKVIRAGKIIEQKFYYFVPYREFSITYSNLENLQRDLIDSGALVKVDTNHGRMIVMDMSETVRVAQERLRNDEYYFLSNEPAFLSGVIPLDGYYENREDAF